MTSLSHENNQISIDFAIFSEEIKKKEKIDVEKEENCYKFCIRTDFARWFIVELGSRQKNVEAEKLILEETIRSIKDTVNFVKT